MERFKKVLSYLFLPITLIYILYRAFSNDRRLSSLKQEEDRLQQQQAENNSLIEKKKNELETKLSEQEGLSHDEVEAFHNRFNNTNK